VGYKRRVYIRTSVFIKTLEGTPVASGVLEGLTVEDALMALTAPLPAGETFRVLLTCHGHASNQVERFGEVVWTRHALNSDEELKAECRVRWVTLSAHEGAATGKALAG